MKNNMCKQLAIVIPTYKDTFFAAALDSIAAQTCKDFTLYIGDDCSPYNIKTIVEEYKDRIDIVYKRFESNLGGTDLVAQWERCIDMSEDEPYIWLFSDDDVMQPRCVEEFFALDESIRNNYIIHFDIKVIDDQNNGRIQDMPSYPVQITGTEFLRLKMKGKLNSFVVEYIIPRELFIKAGRFQNYDLAWGSDIMTWFKLGNICNGIYSINKPMAHVLWRRSNENISPNWTYSITKRKMHAIIENASFVQNELVSMNMKRDFSLHAKQVWTTIVRNAYIINFKDILIIYRMYLQEVGFPLWSTIFFILAVVNKYTKLFKAI